MSKSRKSRHSYKPLFIILAVSLLLGIGYGSYLYFSTPTATPVAIDVISTLPYGEVSLDGLIQKDTVVGKSGNYLLSVKSGNFVMLIAPSNLDGLVGKQAHVTGILSAPSDASNSKNILRVTTITVTE